MAKKDQAKRVTDRPGSVPWLMPDWGRDNQFECETNGGHYPTG